MTRSTFYWGLKISAITNPTLIRAGWNVGMYIVRCEPPAKTMSPTYDAVEDMLDATFWNAQETAETAKVVLPMHCPEVDVEIVKFTLTTSESEA
jgi:hypothetical protein